MIYCVDITKNCSLYHVCYVKRIAESFLENEQRKQNIKVKIHDIEKLKVVKNIVDVTAQGIPYIHAASSRYI